MGKYGSPIGFRDGIPIFKAIRKNAYQMKMFCPFCQHWHSHGYSTELGHRSQHCGDQRIGGKYKRASDSPYAHTGYYILLIDGGKEID